MLISDIEHLEVFTEPGAVMGGKKLRLSVNNDSVSLGLDSQPLWSRKLSNGKPLTYRFSNGISGSLTALRQQDDNQLTQSVSLVGETEDGANFSFSSSYVVKSV